MQKSVISIPISSSKAVLFTDSDFVKGSRDHRDGLWLPVQDVHVSIAFV